MQSIISLFLFSGAVVAIADSSDAVVPVTGLIRRFDDGDGVVPGEKGTSSVLFMMQTNSERGLRRENEDTNTSGPMYIDTSIMDEKSSVRFSRVSTLLLVSLTAFGLAAWRVLNPSLASHMLYQFAAALPAMFACAAFMIVGPALITLNKEIMQSLQFSYPLTLSGLGLLASAITSHFLVATGFASVRPESLDIVRGANVFRVALPIGACKALTLSMGNAAYLYLGLSFIQMLKALCPVFVLASMRAVGVSTPSRNAMLCVLVIVFGTLLEVKGEMHATALGLLLMFGSEVAEAMNLVLTQLCLQNKKLTVLEGLYVLTPFGSMCLFSLAAFFEWPSLWQQGGLQIVANHPGYFFAAATLGVLVNFLGFLVVQHTSSLTCKILNTARSIGLVAIGFVYYGEETTFIELLGYTIAFGGFCGYSYVQATENASSDSELKALLGKPSPVLKAFASVSK